MSSCKKFIWLILPTLVIGYLIVWTFQAFEPGNPFFAFLINWLVMSGFAMYAGFQGWLAAVGWIVAFNILLNGYPVMLQRYNRIRLQAVIGTYKELEK